MNFALQFNKKNKKFVRDSKNYFYYATGAQRTGALQNILFFILYHINAPFNLPS